MSEEFGSRHTAPNAADLDFSQDWTNMSNLLHELESEPVQPTSLLPQVSQPVSGVTLQPFNFSLLNGQPLAKPFSIEAYADSLMDDLFHDVEQALELGTELPTDTITPEVAVLPLDVPGLMLSPRGGSAPSGLVVGLAHESVTEIPMPSERNSSSSLMDRLLVVAGGVSIVLTLGLWLASQNWVAQHLPSSLSGVSAIAPVSPPAPAPDPTEHFFTYFQKALSHIEQQSTVTASLPTGQPLNPASGLLPSAASSLTPNPADLSLSGMPLTAHMPTINIPGAAVSSLPPVAGSSTLTTPGTLNTPANTTSIIGTANGNRTVLERVYIPIYVPAPNAAGQMPSVPIAGAPTTTLPTIPGISTVTAGSPTTTTGVTHTLVGVLMSNDPTRSAALFEINGVTRRVAIGESIGSSGWSLVQVGKEDAVIRRNGEVRSIYIQQKF